jgi:hypothetical protein
MRPLALVFLLMVSLSCKRYSFTGTSLSSDYKTIYIKNIMMNTAGPANLTQVFTEKLKEYYQRNTSLKLKSTDADLVLEGIITGYELSQSAQTSSDKAAQNRLTIRAEISFTNSKDDAQSFQDREFYFFVDFPSEQTLTQVEKKLINTITDQIVLDIFNKTAANW